MNKTQLTLSAATFAGLLAVAGCASPANPGSMPGMDHGNSNTSAPTNITSAEHNAADVMFAQMMIPHHAQAVEMSDAMLAKANIPAAITELANKIKAAQAPEIEKMTGWLQSWNMPVMGSSGHGGHGMDGMVSESDLQKLSEAQGTEASKIFLSQMIAHHEGAISMAKTETSQGKFPEAIQLSKDIVTSQEKEIQEMKALLATL
ncbi:DUF305 domain-containing protein [Paenarthrobacter sp. TYUT067]|uniref:DUF305 domain-containing protein n=1 Tax=Paenarthrobacter sp. TYUT067 TaxID=2926245 RepID=UPI00202FF643|nr:DUF305 domain-containing protein [Paenarthrobacter sp. TYUT067]MCM0615500.1 DUF305 domain-containing protein [Paenarthrobacter sp. TYUT067]